MEKAIKYGKQILAKVGLRGVFTLVMTVCWFIFPFLLWFQLYSWLGASYFNVGWAFIGVIAIAAFVVFAAFLDVKLILVRRKMASRVENASRVFNNPNDPESEERYRQECGKFIIPYLHLPHVYVLGFAGLMQKSKLHTTLIMRTVQVALHLFISYAIFVFLVENRPTLNRADALISSALLSQPTISGILGFLYQNIILVTIVSLIFSSWFSIQVNKELMRFPSYVFDVFYDCFSIFNRISVVGTAILCSPWLMREKMHTLEFSPFTFQPMTTTEIIQQSVENIEQTECKVTVWKYEVKTISDVANLKNMISKSQDIPSNIKRFCLDASDEEILATVNESKPVLYLGIIDNRCSIMGRVFYDESSRIYRATFTFDNDYVKDNFKSIAANQIETQKRLSRKLPSKVTELVQMLKVHEDEE